MIAFFLFVEQRLEAITQITQDIEIINSQYANFEAKVYIYTLLFFIIHSLVLGMLQMCMELKIQSTVALIINIGILLFGIFETKTILPCHLAMIARSSTILGNTTLTITLLILGIILIFIEQVIGRRFSINGFE